MRSKLESPTSRWYVSNRHLLNTPLWHEVEKLDNSYDWVTKANSIRDHWLAYLGDGSKPVPDIVGCIAAYGEARLHVHGWKEFPISIPPEDVEYWRESDYGSNLKEFHSFVISGAAGAFLEPAARDPQLTASLLDIQLKSKIAELFDLIERPIEWYTLEEFTPDEVIEGEDEFDKERIRRPFDLAEELLCFTYAFPKLRTFAATGDNAELGLPSQALYDAMDGVDNNSLYKIIDQVRPHLERILEFLAQQNYSVAIPASPRQFWWRHWKPGRL
ncbi:MAG TPA: hypothetical protein VD907_03745 [Verrucomicrobiae bacterium]|nr:hypothetical protein [Verrucomicrobiae bacterium]